MEKETHRKEDGAQAVDPGACRFCGQPYQAGDSWSTAAAGYDGQVLWCRRCRIGSLTPVPSAQDREALHDVALYRAEDGKRFSSPLESMIAWFSAAKARRIERSGKRGGAVLDIGCGRGLFLHIMARRGWEVAGTEVSEAVAECARRSYGVPVVSAEKIHALQQGNYDVVTLYHVLEHVDDPAALLDRCHALLNEDGLLVVAVPNAGSLQARWGKGSWFHLDPPHHLYQFTAEGLQRLLERHSCRVEGIWHFDSEQNIFGWLQTVQNRFGLPHNLLYRNLMRRELRGPGAAGASLWQLAAAFISLPFIMPAAVLLSLAEAVLLRNGGTIEVHARRIAKAGVTEEV